MKLIAKSSAGVWVKREAEVVLILFRPSVRSIGQQAILKTSENMPQLHSHIFFVIPSLPVRTYGNT